MTECPRCGFIQPDDRYCASCGLDSQTFQPQRRPWYWLLARSPLFQATVSVLVVLLLVMFLFRSQTVNIEQKISQLEHSMEHSEDKAGEEAGDEPEAAENSVVPAAAAGPAAKPKAAISTPAAITEDTGAAKNPESVDVLFFEAARDLVSGLAQEGQGLVMLPSVQVFSLSGADKLKVLTDNAQRLPGSTNKVALKDVATLPFLFQNGSVGLQLDIAPPVSTGDPKHFQVHLKGQTIGSQKGADSQEVRVQFDETFQASPEQPLVVLGMIPNHLNVRAAPGELAVTPFAILNSSSFQQNYTESAIVLKFGPAAK